MEGIVRGPRQLKMRNAPSRGNFQAAILCTSAALVCGCARPAPPVPPQAAAAPPADAEWVAARERMVERQLAAGGIRNGRVLAAMGRVPRHEFVPDDVRAAAYDDRALPIGHRQTISQPYVVAFMTEAVDPRPGQRVLEVGTGSGYQAAVLAE